jgi:hypothetical protein
METICHLSIDHSQVIIQQIYDSAKEVIEICNAVIVIWINNVLRAIVQQNPILLISNLC